MLSRKALSGFAQLLCCRRSGTFTPAQLAAQAEPMWEAYSNVQLDRGGEAYIGAAQLTNNTGELSGLHWALESVIQKRRTKGGIHTIRGDSTYALGRALACDKPKANTKYQNTYNQHTQRRHTETSKQQQYNTNAEIKHRKHGNRKSQSEPRTPHPENKHAHMQVEQSMRTNATTTQTHKHTRTHTKTTIEKI